MNTLITRLRLLVALIVAGGLTAPLASARASAHEGHGETDPFDALVFSKTSGFRHGSIPVTVAAMEQLGEDHGVSTTGDVLNADQQGAFERYIQRESRSSTAAPDLTTGGARPGVRPRRRAVSSSRGGAHLRPGAQWH